MILECGSREKFKNTDTNTDMAISANSSVSSTPSATPTQIAAAALALRKMQKAIAVQQTLPKEIPAEHSGKGLHLDIRV